MTDNQPKMDSIRTNYEVFCGLCDVSLLETLRERVEEMIEEWQSIETRLRNKIASPKVGNVTLITAVVIVPALSCFYCTIRF